VNRAFLILHGIENHRPPGHWQHWLAESLRARGERVAYPALPDPDTPSPAVWRAELDRLLAAGPARETVVVCHSLACLLWIGHAAAIADAGSDVERVALVSPPVADRLPAAGRAFAVTTLDPDGVRRSSRAAVQIVCGEHDPYNPPGARATYAEPLGAELAVVAGAGHITPEEGFGPWPAMLEWCESGVFPQDAASSRGGS
jgi:predicted alpha/beta hydrolase family esterase